MGFVPSIVFTSLLQFSTFSLNPSTCRLLARFSKDHRNSHLSERSLVQRDKAHPKTCRAASVSGKRNACDFDTPQTSLRNPHRTQWIFFGSNSKLKFESMIIYGGPQAHQLFTTRITMSHLLAKKKNLSGSLFHLVSIYICNVKRMLIPRLLWFNRLSMAGSINSIRCGVVVMTATKRPVTCRTQVDHDYIIASSETFGHVSLI